MTLEDLIADIGIDTHRIDPAGYRCPACGTRRELFTLLANEVEGEVICTSCAGDAAREQRHRLDQAEAERLRRDAPWQAALGLEVKAERDRRISAALWATSAETSPLTLRSQEAFRAYVKALHRITVAHARPEDVVWPAAPVPIYSETRS